MAQRNKEETELQFTETLSLCVNNCGLYGDAATNNMCKSCFQAKIRLSTSGSSEKKARSDPIRPAQLDRRAEAEQTPAAAAAEAAARPAAAAAKKAVNRCLRCGKRVGLTGFRCRCGDLFCGDHRYSDRHECGFDYKAVGRDRIQRENPVVRAAKIVRI